MTNTNKERVDALIARFEAAEPEYIQLLESVVVMAEAGDATYKMAKNVLLK